MIKPWKTAINKIRVSKSTRKLLEYINKENITIKNILDYGCGKGFDSDYLSKYYNVDKYDKYYYNNTSYKNKKYDLVI